MISNLNGSQSLHPNISYCQFALHFDPLKLILLKRGELFDMDEILQILMFNDSLFAHNQL